ncbi:MAG: PQQ-binding-like beta-propeller repeat protein [Planctomycetota bacterium]
MLSLPSFVLLALLAHPGPQVSDGRSWPQWRGPARDGVSHETEWSSEGAPAPLWRAEVGLGYSNVAIEGGRLYTLGYDDERAEDRLVCLDVASGARLWSFGWPEALRDLYHGGGTNSTPTVRAGVVYVTGRSGQAFAVDAATGAQRWGRHFGVELELPQATYGFSASPVLVGDALYLTFGATALCVAAEDGALRWRMALGDSEGYATPVPFELDGRALLTNLGGDAFFVQAADTGEVVHRFPFSGDQGSVHACTPIIVGNDVFLSSAYGTGAARVRLGASAEPEVVWRTRVMRNKVSGCVLSGGCIYGFDESMLKCIDFATGADRWRVRGLGLGAVTLAGDRLIVLSSRGEVIVAPATPDGFTELSRRQVLDGGVYWTTPVLLDGRLYVRNSLGSLVCLDHRAPVVAVADQAGEAAFSAGVEAMGAPTLEALLAAHQGTQGANADPLPAAMHLVGSYQSIGEGITPTDATLDLAADGRWRLEWNLGSYGFASRACDGAVAWQADPYYGNLVFEGDALREALETGGLSGLFGGLERATERRVVGRERFDDRDCWRVETTSAGGAQRALFFDATTGSLAGRAAPNEAMTVLRDWRAFDGVMLPAQWTWLMPGTGAEEVFRVERATRQPIDEPLDEALFARPAWVTRMLRSPEQKAADSRRLATEYAALLGEYQPLKGPRRKLVVREGALALEGRGSPSFLQERDAEGRLYFEELGCSYLVFERDAQGQVTALRIEGIPDEDVVVCARVKE